MTGVRAPIGFQLDQTLLSKRWLVDSLQAFFKGILESSPDKKRTRFTMKGAFEQPISMVQQLLWDLSGTRFAPFQSITYKHFKSQQNTSKKLESHHRAHAAPKQKRIQCFFNFVELYWIALSCIELYWTFGESLVKPILSCIELRKLWLIDPCLQRVWTYIENNQSELQQVGQMSITGSPNHNLCREVQQKTEAR